MRAIGNPTPTIHVVDDDASFRTAIGDCCAPAIIGSRCTSRQSSARATADRRARVHSAGRADGRAQRTTVCRTNSPIWKHDPHRLRDRPRNIPMTVQAIKAGAEDVLTKPVSAKQLVGAIEAALARGEEARRRSSRLAVLRSHLSRSRRGNTPSSRCWCAAGPQANCV